MMKMRARNTLSVVTMTLVLLTPTVFASAQNVPHISGISPDSATYGTQMIITGSGFDPTNNDIGFVKVGHGMSKYTGYINNVPSKDGKTLVFELPQSVGVCPYSTMEPDTACIEIALLLDEGRYEVFVLNKNGKSNSMTFEISSSRSLMTMIPTRVGELTLSYSDGVATLSGTLRRSTPCVTWEVNVSGTEDVPPSLLLFHVFDSNKDAICIAVLGKPQTINATAMAGERTFYKVSLENELMFSGHLIENTNSPIITIPENGTLFTFTEGQGLDASIIVEAIDPDSKDVVNIESSPLPPYAYWEFLETHEQPSTGKITFEQIGPVQGTYDVTFIAIDNNGARSSPVTITIEVNPSTSHSEVSVLMKVKNKTILLAVKNNDETPIFGLEIKRSTDGTIDSSLANKGWKGHIISSNTLSLESDNPLLLGQSVIVILRLDSKPLWMSWSALDKDRNVASSDSIIGKTRTIWAEYKAQQCGNPWDAELSQWQKANMNVPLDEQTRLKLIKAYYEKQGISAFEVRIESKPQDAQSCEACFCREGWSVFVKTSDSDLDKMMELGFIISEPSQQN